MRNLKASVPDCNSFVTHPGSDVKVVYSTKVHDDGTIILTPKETYDIQEKIQSYVDQTDISYIIQQLSIGNTTVLNPRTPMYDDFTNAPSDLREAMQTIMDGEKAFYDLPLDTRQKFDNDYRKWLVSAGTDDWLAKMFPDESKGQDSPAPSPDAEINPVEPVKEVKA